MTKFQALFVKLLRVKYDYSWRAIHRDWQIRYKNDKYFRHSAPNGNQLIGIEICTKAMQLLDENIKDGWN